MFKARIFHPSWKKTANTEAAHTLINVGSLKLKFKPELGVCWAISNFVVDLGIIFFANFF